MGTFACGGFRWCSLLPLQESAGEVGHPWLGATGHAKRQLHSTGMIPWGGRSYLLTTGTPLLQ